MLVWVEISIWEPKELSPEPSATRPFFENLKGMSLGVYQIVQAWPAKTPWSAFQGSQNANISFDILT